MDYIPDYNDLYAQHEAEQERKLAKLPKCAFCDEPITDDQFYNIDGTYICKECLKNEYLVNTDDYINE